jgi:hypothetical protein
MSALPYCDGRAMESTSERRKYANKYANVFGGGCIVSRRYRSVGE